jgi:hypothetical protein
MKNFFICFTMSFWQSLGTSITAYVFYFIIGEILMRIFPLRENGLGYKVLSAELILTLLTFIFSFIYHMWSNSKLYNL